MKQIANGLSPFIQGLLFQVLQPLLIFQSLLPQLERYFILLLLPLAYLLVLWLR